LKAQTSPASLLRDQFNRQYKAQVRNSSLKADAFSMEFENEFGGWEVGQGCGD